MDSEKAEFRKPMSDGGCRKYRKRSPVGASTSSDGSPHREKNEAKIAHDKQNKDDGRDYTSGRGGESYKYSDRQSSRNRDRNADDYDRGYSKSSYRSSRDSRDIRGGKDTRHRDYPRDEDKYRREKSDTSGTRSRDKSTYDREGSGRRDGNVEERERSSHRDGSKELESMKYANEDKKRYDDRNRHGKEPEKHYDANSSFSSKGQNSDSKKPRVSNWENSGPGTNGTSEKASVTGSDMDAAKVAAMKAAEQVNKNLVGTGFMSADQKKKLLWGNKKSTTTEEPAHRWNSAIFGDRERQEKFNKLMSLRLRWPIVGRERRTQGRPEARRLECRKATRAAPNGTGETIHGWIASERWQDCWTWSLEVSVSYSVDGGITKFGGTLFYCIKVVSRHTLRLSSSYLIRACLYCLVKATLFMQTGVGFSRFDFSVLNLEHNFLMSRVS